MSGTTGFILSG